MKTLLKDNDGWKIYVEVNQLGHPSGTKHVKFSTVWERARSLVHEQTLQDFFLTESELAQLKSLL